MCYLPKKGRDGEAIYKYIALFQNTDDIKKVVKT